MNIEHDWSRLSSLQLGRLAEYWVKLQMTLCGLDVYTSEVDDKGIDFVVRAPSGRYAAVQVKSSRSFNYIFMRKKHFKPREDLFVSIVLFLEEATPRTYLIPSKAWLNGNNPVLVSRDYPDAASEPEWGIKLSAKGMVHLEPFEIQRIAAGMAGDGNGRMPASDRPEAAS